MVLKNNWAGRKTERQRALIVKGCPNIHINLLDAQTS